MSRLVNCGLSFEPVLNTTYPFICCVCLDICVHINYSYSFKYKNRFSFGSWIFLYTSIWHYPSSTCFC